MSAYISLAKTMSHATLRCKGTWEYSIVDVVILNGAYSYPEQNYVSLGKEEGQSG